MNMIHAKDGEVLWDAISSGPKDHVLDAGAHVRPMANTIE